MYIHTIDILIILGYLLLILLVGALKSRQSTSVDYILMGRRLSLPAFVMTLVSTWYGGILGVSEFSTSYGVSNWVIFGLPYYVFGIVFALLIAQRARTLGVSSLPEIIRNDYGVSAGRLAAVWLLLLANPAPYILTLGFLVSFFFGLPLNLSIVIGTLFSILYIYKGGFRSVVDTDRIQFGLMFLGFFILLLVLMFEYMNPLELWRSLPQSHRSLTGGHNLGYILVWFFIASWTLVDPGFHQRIYATTTPELARKGVLIAVGFWFIFDCMTTLTGLYAFSYLPESTIPAHAFLDLGSQILPVGLQGLFFAGILATVMSTLDSNTLVSGVMVGNDLMAGTRFHQKGNKNRMIQISMLLVLTLGVILAVLLPSVVNLWYTFGTIALPALLLPTLQSIFNRPLPLRAVQLNLILPPLLSFLWYIFAKTDEWSYLLGLEPFYPGIFMSLLILAYFQFIKKESYSDGN